MKNLVAPPSRRVRSQSRGQDAGATKVRLLLGGGLESYLRAGAVHVASYHFEGVIDTVGFGLRSWLLDR